VWPMGLCLYTCNPKQGECEFQKIPNFLHGITARFIRDGTTMNRAATACWRSASAVRDSELEKQKDWEPEVLQPTKLKVDHKLTDDEQGAAGEGCMGEDMSLHPTLGGGASPVRLVTGEGRRCGGTAVLGDDSEAPVIHGGDGKVLGHWGHERGERGSQIEEKLSVGRAHREGRGGEWWWQLRFQRGGASPVVFGGG
jgi:hypothetical protein